MFMVMCIRCLGILFLRRPANLCYALVFMDHYELWLLFSEHHARVTTRRAAVSDNKLKYLITMEYCVLRVRSPDQTWRVCMPSRVLVRWTRGLNNLPADIQAISDTSRFKQSVKTHYFRLAFNVYWLLIVLCLSVLVWFLFLCVDCFFGTVWLD